MNSGLISFLSGAVTPWHAVAALAQKLTGAGFQFLDERAPWTLEAGRGYFFTRGGSSLAAFIVGSDPAAGWTVAAAHTDSPGWRLKTASAKAHGSGVVRMGTEIYGSPIHSTWFDRPLAVAGRVFLKTAGGVREVLVRTEALGIFPNLAIHYNREVNKGIAYDLSEQLSLLLALGPDQDLPSHLARTHGFDAANWVSADLFAVNPAEPRVLGPDGLFLAPRIDNLTGCHGVIEGLLATLGQPTAKTRAALCFDQEEVGSSTWTGADSSFLGDLVARVHGCTGGSSEALFRSKASSFILSVDCAHGAHPNWAGLHDEVYAPHLGKGVVLKASAKFSYATTAESEARVRTAAEKAGVPIQTYVMKSTLSPGSTVGPITTSWTGIPGADVGIPIWAMHSSQETGDLRDQDAMVRLIAETYRS